MAGVKQMDASEHLALFSQGKPARSEALVPKTEAPDD